MGWRGGDPAGLYAPSVVLFCPRCGVELPVQFRGEWFSTNPRCLDCGVALAETPPMLAPSEEELQYGLDEWPLPDRVALTIALAADGIPYRWEPDIVLVVPEVAEEEVDLLLDHLEAQDPELATEGSVGFDGAGEVADGGEEAQAAMVELFLAADRLRRSPLDQVLAADLEVAAEEVAARLPPYGIDRTAWERIQQMAAAAVSSSIDEDVRRGGGRRRRQRPAGLSPPVRLTDRTRLVATYRPSSEGGRYNSRHGALSRVRLPDQRRL